jgi:hypothetical protein
MAQAAWGLAGLSRVEMQNLHLKKRDLPVRNPSLPPGIRPAFRVIREN